MMYNNMPTYLMASGCQIADFLGSEEAREALYDLVNNFDSRPWLYATKARDSWEIVLSHGPGVVVVDVAPTADAVVLDAWLQMKLRVLEPIA